MNPYVVIRMTATGVNTQQSMLVSGIPSLPGMAGFVHHLQRQTGHAVMNFMPVIHRLNHDRGHPKFRPFSGDFYRSYSEVTNPSTLDISTATVDLSLVLRLHNRALDISCQDNFLAHCNNLCGGRVADMPTVTFAETDDELVETLRRGPAGWLVCDRSGVFAGSTDNIDTLLDSVKRVKRTTKNQQRGSRLVPLHVGYLMIETPKERPYMLRYAAQGYRHALAEPITSLGEFLFLHSELKRKTAFDGCWWSYAPVQQGVCRIVSNNQVATGD